MMVAPPAITMSPSSAGHSSHNLSPMMRPRSPFSQQTPPPSMQNSPQPVQEPSSSSSWSSQIRFDAQEARIKGLEANLEAERSLHLQDSEDLRKSNETLRGALMRAEAALRAREDDLAKSKAMLVQFEIELGSLRKSEADWRTLAQ